LGDLSLSGWLETDEEFPGPQMLVENYQEITNVIARNLDIRLNTVVSEIDWSDPSYVSVKTSNGEFHCKQILITLPLGVLKAGVVKFNPPLSQSKQDAIDHLGFGTMNKIVLGFKRAFWEDFPNSSAEFFTYVGDCEEKSFHFLNLRKPYGIPVLVSFTYGQCAEEKEKLCDAEIAEQVMSALKTMFPGLDDTEYKPEKLLVTRWNSDPFAKGSYSFIKVGATTRDYDELATSIDKRIYFSGEATSKEYLGTAHGAFLTGVKAAEEISLDNLGY